MTAVGREVNTRDTDTGVSRAERDEYHQPLINKGIYIHAGRTALNPGLMPQALLMDESNEHWGDWVELVEGNPVQGC